MGICTGFWSKPAVGRATVYLLSAVLAFTYGDVLAEPAFGQETFKVRLGGYIGDLDTNVRLSGPRLGSEVDLEDALGLDSDKTVFRGALVWRFKPRHRLEIDFIDFDRDATAAAGRSFTLETDDGTYEFAAGATVATRFDWRLIPVTYSYSFVKRDNLEVAGTAGVHWFNAKVGYRGEATVTPPGGMGMSVAAAAAEETAAGPLPVFGLSADYALSEKWYVGARVGWFGLDYDDYSGELIDLSLNAEYWFTRYVGAGLGYSRFAIDISESKDGFEVAADFSYHGLNAYVTFRY